MNRTSRRAKSLRQVSSGRPVIILTGILAIATFAMLITDSQVTSHARRKASHQFQHMAGGLGLGATVCPRWCFVNFDVRLEPCTCKERPLPGGYCYCPEHNSTVTSFDSDQLYTLAPATRPVRSTINKGSSPREGPAPEEQIR